jgi:glutamate N-acetyltransferase/amino-acid N-acetyltransferase
MNPWNGDFPSSSRNSVAGQGAPSTELREDEEKTELREDKDQLAWPLPVEALPRGFRGAGVTCGIKKSGRPDLALVVSDTPAAAAVVATKNRFAAAPVIATREHARRGRARAFLVNSGNANAATGKQGLADARRMCALAAAAIGAEVSEVFVDSTGVIGQPLPMDRVESGIGMAASQLSADGINDAAVAILTTDKGPKRAARAWKQGTKTVRLAAFAKGVGMIHPNMATMIAVALTDADVSPAALRRALREAVDRSFNCLTVDGDTSTNDMAVVLANGASGAPRIASANSGAWRRLVAEMTSAFQDLTRAMAADGEGSSRLMTIHVRGAPSFAQARAAGRAVGASSLMKCAVHGADPNWGRVAMALGNTRIAIDPARVTISIAGTTLLRRGKPTQWDARAVSEAMRAPEVRIDVDLGLGRAEATVWASTLTEEYVRFNSAYTT